MNPETTKELLARLEKAKSDIAALRLALKGLIEMPSGYSSGREYSDECARKRAWADANAALESTGNSEDQSC